MQQVLQRTGLVGIAPVENIPGAAGTIGLARFVSAERGHPDTLMVSGLIMLAAVKTHQSPVTLREATPIARLVGEYEVVVVPTASPFRSLADLIDAFRARPESVAWGGGSAGGTDQILAALIADAVGIAPTRVTYIAFSGGGEMRRLCWANSSRWPSTASPNCRPKWKRARSGSWASRATAAWPVSTRQPSVNKACRSSWSAGDPSVLGLILGPLSEQQARRALAISEGNPAVFLIHPISAALLLVAAVALVGPTVWSWVTGNRLSRPSTPPVT